MDWAENFKSGIVAIILIAIIAAALAIAMDSFQDNIEEEASDATIYNESLTYTNATATHVTKADLLRSCDNVWNGTDGVLIGSGNYTCSNAGVTITNEDVLLASTVLVTYTFAEENYAYNATRQGLIGSDNATSYLSTIGTMIAIGALLAIIFFAFMLWRR